MEAPPDLEVQSAVEVKDVDPLEVQQAEPFLLQQKAEAVVL